MFRSFQIQKRANALLRTEHNAGPGQIVWSQLHSHLVAWQDADVVHPHLPRDMPEYHVSIFELDLESCAGQIFQDLALHLDSVFLSHITQCELVCQRVRALPLKLAFFSKLSY